MHRLLTKGTTLLCQRCRATDKPLAAQLTILTATTNNIIYLCHDCASDFSYFLQLVPPSLYEQYTELEALFQGHKP